MAGERIIPLTNKDKRKLRQRIGREVAQKGLQLGVVLLLVTSLIFFRNHYYYRFFIGASTALYAGFLVFSFFRDKSAGSTALLLRDWYNGKKRIVSGRIEQVEYREDQAGQPEQVVYDIGPYRFALHQLSPVLKRFRQAMPGQMVEVHQCLHSGLVLRVEVLGE